MTTDLPRLLRAATAVAVLVVALTPAGARAADPSPATPSAQDRVATMVATLDAGQPYVEESEAGGEAALWRGRLTQALADVDLREPVRVAAWTSVDEQPDLQALTAAGLRQGVYLLAEDGFIDATTRGVDPQVERQAAARLGQAQSVLTEALRLSGRDAGTTEPLPLAEAWVWLRLSAADPPSPVALARELADDPAVFIDSQRFDDDATTADDVNPTSPLTLTLIGLVVLVYLAVRARSALRRRGVRAADARINERWRTAPGVTPATAAAATPSPAEVEQLVTELGVAIAEAPARPGQVDYDRAQTCLDAAERYVDRDDERARIGVQLLVSDGRSWLTGRPPAPRCYFNPRHVARPGTRLDTVVRGGVTLPCCTACSGAVRDGREPAALEVDGSPYFTRADTWTTTGYGSLSQDWAEQVYRDALGRG